MGTFVIDPDHLSSVTCSIMEDATTDYQVVPDSIDMNEVARYDALYAISPSGDVPRRVSGTFVPIRFRMVVWGSTQANALSNLRTITQAITNPEGGYIQYKPLGLAAGVMTTYYTYLSSRPPRVIIPGALHQVMMESYKQEGRSDTEYGIVVECEIMTKPWATSDPESPSTIMSSTTFTNTKNSSIASISASSIKGDVAFPILEIDAESATTEKGFLVQFRKVPTGLGVTNLDWIEGEDFVTMNLFSSQSASGASGGNVARTSDNSGGAYIKTSLPALDSSYVGHIIPLIVGSADGGSTYYLSFKWYIDTGDIAYDDQMSIYSTDLDWTLKYHLKEKPLPPFRIPDNITDDTSVTVAEYLSNVDLEIYVEGGLGSGNLDIDYVILAKTDDWIAVMKLSHGSLSAGDVMRMDYYHGLAHTIQSDGDQTGSWAKYGSPFVGFYLDKRFNYRLRILSLDQNDRPLTSISNDAVLKGIWGTIYPFETS